MYKDTGWFFFTLYKTFTFWCQQAHQGGLSCNVSRNQRLLFGYYFFIIALAAVDSSEKLGSKNGENAKTWWTFRFFKYETLWQWFGSIWTFHKNPCLTADVVFLKTSMRCAVNLSNVTASCEFFGVLKNCAMWGHTVTLFNSNLLSIKDCWVGFQLRVWLGTNSYF